MPPIVATAEIERPAARVFACATDPSLFSQWQKGVEDGHMDGPADGTRVQPVGTKCVTTRRIGGASRPEPGAYGARTARSGQLSTSWSSRSPTPGPG